MLAHINWNCSWGGRSAKLTGIGKFSISASEEKRDRRAASVAVLAFVAISGLQHVPCFSHWSITLGRCDGHQTLRDIS